MINRSLPHVERLLTSPPEDRTALWVIGGYLALILLITLLSRRRRRVTSSEFFLANRSIGSFLLLMSLFGTTMTAFTLIGSTGKAFADGIGVFGLMASSSAIIHSLVFFLIGIPLWAIGKRHGFVTQIQFFRGRFDSELLGFLLFPVLVGLVIPYLLMGIIGAGSVVRGATNGMFPELFSEGAVPPSVSGLIISLVVLAYVLVGGVRAAAIANACQTIILLTVSVVAFAMISGQLGGPAAAAQTVQDNRPELLTRQGISHIKFLSYCLVPLSIGMFPHIFQHWLTAKSAKTFRVSVVAHPIFITIVWAPCVLIGVWAAGIGLSPPGGNANAVLPAMVGGQLQQPLISGLLTAGILAAIMSSLDSQFVCLGTIFTHDIVLRVARPGRFDDRQKTALGRAFIVAVVAITYALSLVVTPNIFDLGVWCFSGFASLFPLVFAAIYWRRATRAGAVACVLVASVTWAGLFYDGLLAPSIAGESGGEYMILGMMPVTIMLAASTLALVVVSLLTTPPAKSTVDRFFPDA